MKNELPHDNLSEKSFIGCLLIDSESFDEISDLDIHKDDFYNPRFGLIFEVITDLAHAHSPVDYVSVHSKLEERGKLDMVGGQSFLTEIVEDQASSANIYHYGKTVKDKSSLRKIIKMAEQVVALGKGLKGDVGEFVQEVESKFFQLTTEAKTGRMNKISHFLSQNLKELQDNERKPGDIRGYATTYDQLDRLLLGMQAGQLIVLAARPSMGKTSLGLNIGHRVCEKHKCPVAIFSLEMMGNELSMRLLTSKAKVDARKIKTKSLEAQELPDITSALESLSLLPIFINDSGGSTIFDIQSQCRRIKAQEGLGLVIIDYLQLINPYDKSISREQQISEMSRSLKNMAKELECPVLALSQLNRAVEARMNKRPMIADLRESGAIEQDADVVIFIYRDEVYNPDTAEPGVAEVIVGKNRSGETGQAKLKWVSAYTSFENMAFAQEQDSMEAVPAMTVLTDNNPQPFPPQ